MCPVEFAYWLKGYFELSESNTLTDKQVSIIKKHLELVFTNVTKEAEPGEVEKYLGDILSKPPMTISTIC